MRTGNPTLNEKVFKGAAIPASGEVMTLEGTVNKTIMSIILTVAAAYWSFTTPAMAGMYLPFIIGGLIIAVVVTFKKEWAPVLTPAYAVVEGLAMGTISLFAETMYPGIVFQAVSLTFGVLFCLLMAYKSGLIRATENFKLGVVAATGAIFFVYLISFVMSFFGSSIPFLHSNGLFGIGISAVIVVVAALNLVLDFDFIENAAESGQAPKYMEWYGAFGLLVTLIWLYIEILRLLMKLQSRD